MTSEHDPKKRRHRKKKNKFLQNAKGFAKQGIFGRGTHIDDDQYQYFINILDAMKSGFEDVEEKVNMANNVFETTKTQEIHLASNQIVCKVLESLVGYTDAENLERYFAVFADSFRPICSDRFASHVLQKMVEIAFLRGVGKESLKQEDAAAPDGGSAAKRAKPDLLSEEAYNLETEFGAEHKQNCAAFVLRVGKFLLNNLEDFVWDRCASHIMRTCVLCLAGVHVPKVAFEKGFAELTKTRKLYTVPSEEWPNTMKEYAQRLEMWPQFGDLPFDELTSALLGVICVALRVCDKNALKHFGKKILMDALLKVDVADDEKDKKIEILDDDDEAAAAELAKNISKEEAVADANPTKFKLPKVFEYQTAVILLETLLTVAGPKLLTQLYAMLFAGRVHTLAVEPLTNFAVQKLLQHIKEKEDFESIFAELAPHTEELLKCGHTGVVQALVAACLRLAAKQSQMIVALQTALHVAASDKEKSRSLFACLVKLKPYDVMRADTSAFVHLHGSLIIQHVLHFNKPIFLVTCIVETPADQLTAVFNTPNGSHIADAFVQSKFIGEKSREKLIRHLEGFYLDLAISKFGSRVVESVFAAAAQEAQQARIVKELADKANMLKSTPFGRLLYNKFRVETYRLSATQWRASMVGQKTEKAELLFKDIVT